MTDDALTDVPATGIRNQRDTGNCWLYATTSWVESLEYAARIAQGSASKDDPRTRPAHFSVAYLDYWDWYEKITNDGIKSRGKKAIADELDTGGSWGAAAEIIAKHGLMRLKDFEVQDAAADAQWAMQALATMSETLAPGGALGTKASRQDKKAVIKELNKAFAVKGDLARTLKDTFGADGSQSFAAGNATGNAQVLDPRSFQVMLVHGDGRHRVGPLMDAIGQRAGDGPDKRTGEWAWSVNDFDATDKPGGVAFLRRIQRALHANVPLPISWYVASNGDPQDTGEYRGVPATAADADDSGAHETVIYDYEAENVPGFGTLKAGQSASPAAREAALRDPTTVKFLRVKNSWGARAEAAAPKGYNDLYIDYLTAKIHVCPANQPDSQECSDEVPLEDVTLPPGF